MTDPLTPEEIEQAERPASEATPGPWKHDSHSWSPWVWREHPDISGVAQGYVFRCGSREDARFVTSARSLVPRLLAAHRAHIERIAELTAERDAREACWSCPDCAFTFATHHALADGSMSCPVCSEYCLATRIAELEAALVEACDIGERCSRRSDVDARLAAIRAVASKKEMP